jgi:hypothetical protein
VKRATAYVQQPKIGQLYSLLGVLAGIGLEVTSNCDPREMMSFASRKAKRRQNRGYCESQMSFSTGELTCAGHRRCLESRWCRLRPGIGFDCLALRHISAPGNAGSIPVGKSVARKLLYGCSLTVKRPGFFKEGKGVRCSRCLESRWLPNGSEFRVLCLPP